MEEGKPSLKKAIIDLLPETRLGRGIWFSALAFAILGIFAGGCVPVLVWLISKNAPDDIDYAFLSAAFDLAGWLITLGGFLFAGYELWRTMKSLRKPSLVIKLISLSLSPIPIAKEYQLLLTEALIQSPDDRPTWKAKFKMYLSIDGDTTQRFIYIRIYPTEWTWSSEDSLSEAICTFQIIGQGEYTGLPKPNADLPRGWRRVGDKNRISFYGGPDVVILPGVDLYIGEFEVNLIGYKRIGGKLPPPIHENVLFIEAFSDNAQSAQIYIVPGFPNYGSQ